MLAVVGEPAAGQGTVKGMALCDLDHVVVVVEDLDEAATTFENLGFLVTPRSHHPFGTANRLVVLDGSYLELVTVTRADELPATGFARFVADDLAEGRVGPSLLALRSRDPRADHARLEEARIPVEPILHFGRDANLPDGTSRRVEFEVVFPSSAPDGPRLFLCHHLDPEVIWDPRVLAHGNGARSIKSVRLREPGPAWWERLAAMGGGVTADSPAGAVRIFVGPPEIIIVAEEPASATVAETTITLVPPEGRVAT